MKRPAMDPARKDSTDRSDEELMLLFQQGQRNAFDEIVARFKNPSVQFCNHYVQDSSLAHDLAQETFLAIYKSRETYQPVGLLRTWIFAIARNQVYSPEHYGQGGDDDLIASFGQDAPPPVRKLEMAEQAERIRAAIDELPPIYREVVYLRAYKDLSYREIASTTEVSESTLRTRMEYALNHLRNKMNTI